MAGVDTDRAEGVISLKAWPDFLEEGEPAGPVDWAAVFGVSAPLEVEIGSGNGRFLRRAATERPDRLFVGIERSLGYARRARDRMVKYNVGNVRVVKADATSYLSTHFQPASIDTLHVYFTDPWPKKRHAKRRLFQPSFVEMVHRVLRPNGQLLVKVDLFWYFEEIFGLIERSPRFEVLASGSETDSERDLYEVTAFEHKALVKKGAVFFLRARNLANE